MTKFLSVLIVLILVFSVCSSNFETVISETEEEPFSSVVSAPEYFYEFREGVVKYSSIDPESDFAKSAADCAKTYLEKSYSENSEIESFEITDIEVDINTTNWNVNAYLYGDTLKNKDVLNNFLVIRYRSNIKLKEGLVTYFSFPDHDFSEPLEGHLSMIYDSEDKYDFEKIEGNQWKVWNTNCWSWTDNIHTEEEMFDVFYARKNEYLPIYTSLRVDDKLSLLAEEYVKEYLENEHSDGSAYVILDVKANINHTNWYINTLQYPKCTVGDLENHVVCVSYRFMKDLELSEHNVYLLYDCGDWIILDSSSYSFDAFDNLSEEDLIGIISSMKKQ